MIIILNSKQRVIITGSSGFIGSSLYKYLKNKNQLSSNNKSSVKDNDGNTHKTLPQSLIDLNDYQPDFSLFDEKRFFR